MVSCEVINIGTELLLGDILNTNSRFLSVELAKLGIDLYYHISVGDNKVRIMDTIQNSLYRSNIVIITGGLGPTPDDITVESIAELFNEDLVSDDKIIEDLKDNGIIIGKGGIFGNVLRIKPPMIITKANVDTFMQQLQKTLSKIVK